MSSESDDTQTPDRQTVADPEEFNQQRRLRSIHDARDRARATYEATQDPSVDADYQTLAATYRATVQNYIGEIEGLLRQYDFDDDENDYWTDYDLGPLTIQPPRDLRSLHDQNDVTIIGNASLTPISYNVPGLEGYLKIAGQCPLQETFSLPVRQRHQGQQTVSATVSTDMPLDVSYEAYRIANRFLTGVGFDVEIESGEHRSVVDDDALEEVEEWRKGNLDQT